MRKTVSLVLLVSMMWILAACMAEQPVSKNLTLPPNIPDFVKPTDFDQIDWNQKAQKFGDRGIIGNERKSGVIGADAPSLVIQKWMWHVWGEHEGERLTIVGFHKESGTVHPVLIDGWTTVLGGPNNGADAHAPSNVKFPEKGQWAILLYTEDQLYDRLVVEITE